MPRAGLEPARWFRASGFESDMSACSITKALVGALGLEPKLADSKSAFLPIERHPNRFFSALRPPEVRGQSPPKSSSSVATLTGYGRCRRDRTFMDLHPARFKCAVSAYSTIHRNLVRREGLEPPPIEGSVSKTDVSAIPPAAHCIKTPSRRGISYRIWSGMVESNNRLRLPMP